MRERLLRDRDQALHALAAHELGIAYSDIRGSPWGAAAMAVLFPAGAILALIPFRFVADHALAVGASLDLAGLGLFALGAAITRFQLAFRGVLTWRSLRFRGLARFDVRRR